MEDFNRYSRIQHLVEKRTTKKNHWSALEVETMILEVLCQVSEEEIDFLEKLEKRHTQPN
jgi:chromatin segregation and condensation protein Rec8/ScpA/Scc1 (kleisin family)